MESERWSFQGAAVASLKLAGWENPIFWRAPTGVSGSDTSDYSPMMMMNVAVGSPFFQFILIANWGYLIQCVPPGRHSPVTAPSICGALALSLNPEWHTS